MRHARISRGLGLAALATALAAASALAQHREYYVHGRVVDSRKTPVAGAAIRLREVATSRSYHLKTDKEGAFRFAGLPHGRYEVTIDKEGYARRTEEWKFEKPQDRMQKVPVPDVVLVSEEQVRTAERQKEAEGDVELAGGKLRQGDAEGAIALLQRVLAANPDNAHALFLLGLGYARTKRCREAIGPLTEVTRLNPGFPGAYFELGLCLRHLDQKEEALAAYGRALDLDPVNADAAYNAGLILFETNRVDEALTRFQEGLALKPADPDLLEMAARCHINKAQFAAALAYLEKARAGVTEAARAAFLDGLIATTRAQVR